MIKVPSCSRAEPNTIASMHTVTSPTPSGNSSFTNLSGIDDSEGKALDEVYLYSLTEGDLPPDLSTELLVLDSLFPVVKHLPGLTREEHSGYVSHIS
jgi:hypothetical protein